MDWITLKALEGTANGDTGRPPNWRADIERYLGKQAGLRLVRPAGRTVFGSTSGVIGWRFRSLRRARALLIAFAVTQSIQLRHIERERDRGDRITQFMTGMFKVSDPNEARGNTITAREILDKASGQINTELAKDPELQAQLMEVMGSVYRISGFSRAPNHCWSSLFERAACIFGPEIRRLCNPWTIWRGF